MSEYQTKLHSVPSGGFLTDRDKDKKPILDVRELGIDFGGLTAVDGFNLMIGRNEITGLIGPNGAGKTTIFNNITGIYAPGFIAYCAYLFIPSALHMKEAVQWHISRSRI